MLVDPRPYTYQYRKPRFSNPTFQSRNLYESLYNKNPPPTNDYLTPRSLNRLDASLKMEKNYNQREDRYQRNSSDVRDRNMESYNLNTSNSNHRKITTNPENIEPDFRLPSIPTISKRGEYSRPPSPLNNINMSYSNNPTKPRQGFQRFRIYERQQKPFNIINCFPKEQQSNELRNFPKLTLEDRLIERGSYHTFTMNKQ